MYRYTHTFLKVYTVTYRTHLYSDENIYTEKMDRSKTLVRFEMSMCISKDFKHKTRHLRIQSKCVTSCNFYPTSGPTERSQEF